MKEVRSKEDLNKLDTALFNRLFQTLFEKGIYLPPSPFEAWFVSSAHTEKQLEFNAVNLNFIKIYNKINFMQ